MHKKVGVLIGYILAFAAAAFIVVLFICLSILVVNITRDYIGV